MRRRAQQYDRTAAACLAGSGAVRRPRSHQIAPVRHGMVESVLGEEVVEGAGQDVVFMRCGVAVAGDYGLDVGLAEASTDTERLNPQFGCRPLGLIEPGPERGRAFN